MRHVVNPVVRRVAFSPLARWTGALALLTFTTRRTGRHLQFPVLTHEVNSSLLVFTDAAWAANFRGGHAVTLTRRGHRYSGEAYLSEDPQETAAALRTALRQLPSPRRLGLVIDPQHQPTDDELATLRRMIRISI
jgi:hypothetical protein